LKRYGVAGELGTVRFLYCHERKILSIHYFELQGGELTSEEFLSRRDYTQQMVLRKSKEKTKVFLARNKLKRKLGLVQNEMVYKIVSLSVDVG